MTRYRDMPIRLKLTLLVGGTAAAAILFMGMAEIGQGVRSARSSTESGLTSLAEVIGANCAAALVFDDRTAAAELLQSLTREPLVMGAGVYDAEGRLFASFVADGHATTWARRQSELVGAGGSMDVSAEIREGGELLGSIVIRASLSGMRSAIIHVLKVVAVIIAVALGGAALLGTRLQRAIADPILRLADTTRAISREGDYSVRVVKESDDEIGVLYDEFNEMLLQIQRRDRAVELVAAIEQVVEAIVITGRDGTIEYVNPAFERMSAFTREEAVGQNPRILKSGKQGDDFYRDLWDTLGQGSAWKGHLVNKRKDGTLYEQDATISPVVDGSGCVTKYVATMRDVTREREIEQRLRQSEKMESIGQLAGGIAHDLNNIITGINGHIELLMMRAGPSSDLAREGGLILKSGERAAALVRKILAFSRRQMLRPKEIDLRSVVGGMNEMLRWLVKDAVDLSIVTSADIGLVNADPSQIEQVVMNLVMNARDAMPSGGRVTIEFEDVYLDKEFTETHPGVTPGPYVSLVVNDTGEGMDEETCLRAFEPFFTTKDKSKGTGLGLSTVHGIIQQSGGVVEIESEVGRGTTVRAYLPRVDGSDSAVRRGSDADTAENRGGETVLVVDDEDPVRGFVSTVLRDAGYDVLEARGGQEAIDVAKAHKGRLDLTVTDVMMPGMGGAELARALERLRPEARVLYMSGYPASAISGDNVLGENKHFLAKPFTPGTLARKVREVLTV